MPTLTPAYGRDYKNKADLEADLKAGKDFIFNDASSRWHGKPCSPMSDLAGQSVRIRYDGNRKVAVFKL